MDRPTAEYKTFDVFTNKGHRVRFCVVSRMRALEIGSQAEEGALTLLPLSGIHDANTQVSLMKIYAATRPNVCVLSGAETVRGMVLGSEGGVGWCATVGSLYVVADSRLKMNAKSRSGPVGDAYQYDLGHTPRPAEPKIDTESTESLSDSEDTNGDVVEPEPDAETQRLGGRKSTPCA
ncbi:hypothetical protein B0H14DRAFT_3880548 [Mycena olivaceomarginata]|nr:hypothetical protein B0H14DRAFT_3880548 [Mycena olivaceomarginata]